MIKSACHGAWLLHVSQIRVGFQAFCPSPLPAPRAPRRVLAFARACPATSPRIPCAAARRDQSSPRRCAPRSPRRNTACTLPPAGGHYHRGAARRVRCCPFAPPWSRASQRRTALLPAKARSLASRRPAPFRAPWTRESVSAAYHVSLRRSRRGVLPVGAALLSQARPFPVKSRSPLVCCGTRPR